MDEWTKINGNSIKLKVISLKSQSNNKNYANKYRNIN